MKQAGIVYLSPFGKSKAVLPFNPKSKKVSNFGEEGGGALPYVQAASGIIDTFGDMRVAKNTTEQMKSQVEIERAKTQGIIAMAEAEKAKALALGTAKPDDTKTEKSKTGLYVGIGAGVLVLVLVLFFVLKK